MKVVVENGADKGAVFRLLDGMNTLGRDIRNRIMLSDPKISRRHFTLRKVGQSLYLSDLDTRNGTTVNGKPVSEKEVEVSVGDCIMVGSTTLRVIDREHASQGNFERPSPAFSFSRVISKTIFGRGQARGPKTEPDASYKFLPKGSRAIWKTQPTSDRPAKESKSITVTDPD